MKKFYACFLALEFFVSAIYAQTIRPEFPTTNGSVTTIIKSGNTIYIGGSFTSVGDPNTPYGVAVSFSGAADFSYAKPNGQVRIAVPDGSGGWYIGGSFTQVAGQPRNRIARINSNGSLNPWNPNVEGLGSSVDAIAVSGNTVYIGGYFLSVGGQTRNNIAAFNATTGALLPWDPNADHAVSTIAVSGNTVYVGGFFVNIGGQHRPDIAALDAVTGLATSWSPPTPSGVSVYTILVNGNTIYAGGFFSSLGGQPRNGLAALDATTGLATSWNPMCNGQVYALTLKNNSLYVGGLFTSMGGQARNNIAVVDTNTGLAASWNPGANAYIYSFVLAGSKLYTSGGFTLIAGTTRNRLAAFDLSSGALDPWNPNADNAVYSLAFDGTKFYAGGDFSDLGGPFTQAQPRNRLAALDATTGAILPWNPDANGVVRTISAMGNTIYIGGSFTTVGGQSRLRLAAVDAVSGALTPWTAAPNTDVNKIIATSSAIYVAGDFTFLSGIATYMAKLDPVTGARLPFQGGTDAGVNALALNGNSLFVGGNFTGLSATTRFNIGAVDAATGAALSWNPGGTNSTVFSVAAKENTVYAGGGFTGVVYNPLTGTSAVARNRAVAFDAATAAVLPWNPNINGSVLAIEPGTIGIYLGGSFGTVNGQPRNNLALVDATTGVPLPWAPNPNGAVLAILADGNTVFVGGAFTTIAGENRSYFAALANVSSTPPVITCPANSTVSNAPNTCGQNVSFAATATGSPSPTITYSLGSTVITSPYNFPVGTSTVTATSQNSAGSSSCAFTVTVNDTQAPVIHNLTASPNSLWPANHKMRDVWVAYTTTDNCPGTINTQLSVRSNEPATQDWEIIDNHHVQLRAERSGNGNGRIYTIAVTATDQYGNTSRSSTVVSVPHDQSKAGNVRSAETLLTLNSELLVRALSNPGRNYFTLLAQSGNATQKITLRLYDVGGRLLEVKNNVAVGEAVQMGKLLSNGFYVLEYSQGSTVKQTTLIKQ